MYWRDVFLLLLTWFALCLFIGMMPGCAHPPKFLGPMCTEDPTLNDTKPKACLDLIDAALRMCVFADSTYLVRQGCWGEWFEPVDDTVHVP